jgi:hypothetical protein
MIVTIEYKARLTYTERTEPFWKVHKSELHEIRHQIDTETLETRSFEFKPVIAEDLDEQL